MLMPIKKVFLALSLLVWLGCLGCGNAEAPSPTLVDESANEAVAVIPAEGDSAEAAVIPSDEDSNNTAAALLPTDGGLYRIVNHGTGRQLNMQLAGMIDHAKAMQMGETGMLDEIWKVERDGDAWLIVNAMTRRSLSYRSCEENGIIELLIDGGDAAKWSLREEDGCYRFTPYGSDGSLHMGLLTDAVSADNFPVLTSQAADNTALWELRETSLTEPLPYMLPVEGEVFQASCPQIIKYEDTYFMYIQYPNILIKSSEDLIHWKTAGRAFAGGDPSWFTKEVPGYAIWAPSVYEFGGRYYLYYCISTLGSQNSAIGVAVKDTPDPGTEGEWWVDLGMVIRSHPGTPYNCIDPNINFDEDGNVWLTFGSYWNGIYQLQIDPETGHLLDPEAEPIHIAKRTQNNGAIEAPVVIRKDGWYYLFTAFNPMNLSYHNRVGRSENIHGPYVDKDGQAMLNGGGTPITSGLPELQMPGHGSVFLDDDGQYYFVCEYFRGKLEESPTIMMISTIEWDEDGWPVTALTPDIENRLSTGE